MFANYGERIRCDSSQTTRYLGSQYSRMAEVAALGVLVKIGPWKRFFIRVIETILRPVVSLVERLRSREIHISREVRSILVLEYWNLGIL